MKGLTFEQILLMALLAVGLLLRVLRQWDARRRGTERTRTSSPDETTPEPREEMDEEPYPMAPPPGWKTRMPPTPPPASPRPALRAESCHSPWLALPTDLDGWRRAIVLMTVLGPPRASDLNSAATAAERR